MFPIDTIVSCTSVRKSFNLNKDKVDILKGIDLDIAEGDFVALIGESGSGKSTFLNILGGLNKASDGKIVICGEHIENYTEDELTSFRRRHIGFIFQSYNLINHLSALENVEMPLMFSGVKKAERTKIATEMLIKVGLEDRINHKPSELSGGQQQRVSIARALVNKPKLVLADEPTGNLDSQTSYEVLDLLKTLNTEDNITFVVVTHSGNVTEYSNKVIKMQDGIIIN